MLRKSQLRSDSALEFVRLTVKDFQLLRESGAFAGYFKAELLDGELWGVFRAPDDMPQWDNMVPILLRPCDYQLLRESGAFEGYAKSRLVDGEIRVAV